MYDYGHEEDGRDDYDDHGHYEKAVYDDGHDDDDYDDDDDDSYGDHIYKLPLPLLLPPEHAFSSQ